MTGSLSTLVVLSDDDDQAADLVGLISTKENWQCVVANAIDDATQLLVEAASPIVVVCINDQRSYDRGRQTLRTARATKSPAVVIYDQLDSLELLELFRDGAAECLGRPVNMTRLSLVLEMFSAPKQARGASGTAVSAHAGAIQSCNADAAPQSNATIQGRGHDAGGLDLDERLLEQVHRVASLDTTVVITGETGTGKTRLAKAIHHASSRCDKPFLAVNCGALSETLMDSELFGHVRGAFTGADQNRTGKLEQALDGTLLLDEIDMLSASAQVKLLQVVEERTFQPVGGTEFQPLRARLIVASNRALKSEVEAKRFRSDLYYRLNVIAFQLPPLRERQSEIPRLASEFAAEFSSHHGFPTPEISLAATLALQGFAWPGNVRELRNTMERAVILSSGLCIELAHLPEPVQEVVKSTDATPQLSAPALDAANDESNRLAVNRDNERVLPSADGVAIESAGIFETLANGNKLVIARLEAERQQLLNALRRNDNNRSKTAIDLGISRVALYKRLRKLHLL